MNIFLCKDKISLVRFINTGNSRHFQVGEPGGWGWHRNETSLYPLVSSEY